MAIVFTPKSGTAFTIGGETTVSNGLAGPFANLSISKELRKQDSVTLGERYSISISGTALISGDHLTKGARQGKVFEAVESIVKSAIGLEGTLDIASYGGLKNMQFTNAFLVSAEASDQDESSMGTQNQLYSFTFEAFDDKNAEPFGTSSATPTKWIESYDESWEVGLQDSPYSSIDGGVVNHKTFTISHSISAQAVSPYPDSTQMGYTMAKLFVEAKINDTPLGPPAASAVEDDRQVAVDLKVPTDYLTYNHIRQRTQNISGGSYSVSDTWVASRYPATHSVDYSFNRDPSAEYNTVDVSVSATGLDSTLPSGPNPDKYANALVNWDVVKTAAENGATTFYALVYPLSPFTLRTVKRSTQESHNKTEGTLSYSCTFDDAEINYPNAISESLSVSYDNVEALNNIVVIIPVLEKVTGPVIQDMCTTNEKVVSVSLDLTMGRENRTYKPGDGGTTDPTTIADAYKPSSVISGPYQRTKSENWNPYSGSYNLSIEWVYI